MTRSPFKIVQGDYDNELAKSMLLKVLPTEETLSDDAFLEKSIYDTIDLVNEQGKEDSRIIENRETYIKKCVELFPWEKVELRFAKSKNQDIITDMIVNTANAKWQAK